RPLRRTATGMTTAIARPPADATTDLLDRLRKIEGQVRGIAKMVERGDRRLDVLTQLAAARAALAKVGVHVVDADVRDAFAGAGSADRAAAQTIAAVHRLLGCHTNEGDH